MNEFERKDIASNTRREIRRDEMADFKRQFLDPKNGNRLREGLTVNEVMEKAKYRNSQWSDVPLALRPFVYSARAKGAYGIPARPWEENGGYSIFGNEKGDSYYFIHNKRGDFAWSRLWVDGDTPRFESLNHDSSLSEIIETVAFHEFGEKPATKAEAVEQTREKAKKRLARPWEEK